MWGHQVKHIATSDLLSLSPASGEWGMQVPRSLGKSAWECVHLTNSGHWGCSLSGVFWVKLFSRASSMLGKENVSRTASAEVGAVCVIRGFLFLVHGFVLVLPTVSDISCNTNTYFILTETRYQPGRKTDGKMCRVPVAMQGGIEWDCGTQPVLRLELVHVPFSHSPSGDTL